MFSARRVITIFSVLVILSGILLRFSFLDLKLFWFDESISATRIVGTSESEIDSMFNNEGAYTYLYEYSKLREIRPEKNFIDTIKTGLEDSHVTPLYYLLSHFWVLLFGDSISAIRAFSALVSVFSIGAMFWCTHELLKSTQASWIAATLFASSPFVVVYSQEARMYGLWSLAILFSHVFFVRALRNRTLNSWLLYSVSVAFSFYSHLLTIFVVISHAFYVFLSYLLQKNKLTAQKTLKEFSLSILGAAFLFSPWIYVIFTKMSGIEKNAGWLDKPTKSLDVINTFLTTISASISIFPESYRIPFWSEHFSKIEKIILISTVLLFLLTILYLAKKALHNTNKDAINVHLFALCLVLTPILTFIFPAAFLEKTIGTVERYYFPLVIALQLSFALFLYASLRLISVRKTVFIWSTICVLSLTCSYDLVTEKDIWLKGWNSQAWSTIDILKAIDKPILITTSNQKFHLLTLSYYLDPKTELLLAKSMDSLDVDSIRSKLESGYEVFSFLEDLPSTKKLESLTGFQTEILVDKGGFFLSRLNLPSVAS